MPYIAPRFVGREAETARLLQVWADAASAGEQRTVLVSGEPGIGKTRLVGEVVASLRREGVTVLTGRADDPSTPFQAWTTALRSTGFVDELGSIARGVADAATARTLLFEAAVGAIAAVAPAVIVLDDLQWADDSTLALARHLARGAASGPLLLALVHRDVGIDPRGSLAALLGDLAADEHTHRMSVVGLTAEEVRELTGRDDAALLHERTGGNPFFVGAVVAYGGDGPPPDVADVVDRRVQQLTALAQRAIAVAATCGPRAAVRLVDDVVGASSLDALEECERAGLLIAVDEHEYEFTHDLVRECVLDRTSPPRRSELHRAVAHALSTRGAEPADVDRHLLALDGADARAAAVAAADRARAMHAHETAASHRARAYELATDARERYDLAVALAEDHARSGSIIGELHALRLAASCAVDPTDVAAAVARLPMVFDVEQTSMALIDDALERLPPGDSPARARVLLRRFYEATDHAHPDDVRANLDDALAMAARTGDHATLARGVIVRSLYFPDTVTDDDLRQLAAHEADVAAVYGARTLRRARGIDITRRLANGDAEGARREVQRLTDDSLETSARWTIAEWHALQAFLDGRFDDARRLGVEAESIGLASGEDLATPNRLLRELFVAIERGESAPDPGADGVIVGAMRAHRRVIEARVAAASGDLDPARQLLDGMQLTRAAVELRWPILLFTLAELVALVGTPEEVTVLHTALVRHCGTVIVPPMYPSVCLGAADRFVGLLAERAGDHTAARDHLARALELDVRIGADLWAAHDRLHLGRLLLDDEPERATALLEAAEREARRMGAVPLATRAASERDIAVFRADGAGWLAVYDGRSVRLPDRRGLGWLAELLARPGQTVAALDLVGGGSGDRQAILDDEAKAAYRARLRDLDAELEEAAASGDVAAGDRARLERDALLDELSHAVGLAGRDRPLGADSERARLNVTRAVRRAIDEVRRTHPALAEHLDATVRTGLLCSYTPDPRSTPRWRTNLTRRPR